MVCDCSLMQGVQRNTEKLGSTVRTEHRVSRSRKVQVLLVLLVLGH